MGCFFYPQIYIKVIKSCHYFIKRQLDMMNVNQAHLKFNI